MSMLPSDDNILLSLVNTALRDGDELADFCARYFAEEEEVLARLTAAGYHYDEESKAFKLIQN
ncbi:MAG: DUF4250 domain-containing protein [Clostridiales bacterium]|nr:DUF4250 domain-containing protein [Clostridiales bacterium]